MKIAMVSEHASPLATLGGVDAGGQNVHVAALATQLAQICDSEVVVYTRRDDKEIPTEVAFAPSVTVRHIDAGPPEVIPKDNLLPFMNCFAEQLSAAWQQNRPDVVHAHFWMSALAALQAARPLGIPVVVTFHALGIEKRRHQGAADTSPAERAAHELRIADSADLIVATSRAEIHELALMGASPARLDVVPCGVDVSLFRPRPEHTPYSRGRRILVVGRLVQRKGVEEVVAALRQVPDAQLLIAGGPDGSALFEDVDVVRIAACARREGVEKRVTFLGRVAHDLLPAVITSADVVVCAPWYEPFGIVPLEAMACGVPVVATSVGGLLDTVVDGVTGFHVPAGDVGSLAVAINKVLEDPILAARLGAAGARRMRLYAWPQIASTLYEDYRALLSSPFGVKERS